VHHPLFSWTRRSSLVNTPGLTQLNHQSDLSRPPRSAPANLSTFIAPPLPIGYVPPNAPGPSRSRPALSSPDTSPYSLHHGIGLSPIYRTTSPAHSAPSTPSMNMTTPPQTDYFTGILQYQGIHSAMVPPTYTGCPPQHVEPPVIPQGRRQRGYDLNASKSHLRQSVG